MLIYTRDQSPHRGKNPEQRLEHVADTNRPHRAKAFTPSPAVKWQKNTGARGKLPQLGRTGTAGVQRRQGGVEQRWVSWSYLASIQRMRFSR